MNQESIGAQQPRRWRSPLLVATLAGFVFALASGSVLLFYGGYLERREYWGLVHWVAGVTGLVPYAAYQWRHYRRARQFSQATHYRAGLHSFFILCATVLTGVPLITPLQRGTVEYTVVDLAHMFFGFVFAILLASHLTLVAVITVSRVPPEMRDYATTSIRFLVVTALATTIVLFAVFGIGRQP
ncbi:MAG TPA: hypothetical protein VJ011_07915 [Steroidobacteraceae bacterium]|nr:hypothetical protein [Steroidobacteraceae bacterium]